MRQLLIHVGMHKTGTTTIQETLFRHREQLPAHGLAYFGLQANHSNPLLLAFLDNPSENNGLRRAGFTDPAKAAAVAQEMRAALATFLRSTTQDKLIVSGESASVLGYDGVRAMIEFCRPHVDQIVVVAFIRPPRSFAVSMLQQQMRIGQTLDAFTRGILPTYRRRFQPYVKTKGVAVRFQLYASQELIRDCSLATFLSVIGAPADLYGALKVKRANSGMSRLAAALALAANAAVPVFGEGRVPNAARAESLSRLISDLPGPPFRVPDAVIARHFRDVGVARDFAWMESVLGRRFSDVEPEVSRAEMDAAPDMASWAARELCRLDGDEIQAVAALLNRLAGKPAPDAPRAAPVARVA